MVKTVLVVLVLGVPAVALAEDKPERQNAAAGASRPCDLMSREEVLFCQAARQTGARGVRNNLCESVSADTIERCLVQQESLSSDPANEFRDREDGRAASG